MQEFKENYLNQNERMNPQLENMLKSNTTDLADNPAFPKTDANGNPINFLELIAYKRFLEVVERVKRYTNLTNVTGQAGMNRLTPMLMQGVNFIEQVEQPHKLALENLAVDLVVEEMEIPDGVFQFQCKIVNRGEINQDGFQKETKEPSDEEINQTLSNQAEAENMTPSEFFEMEKHKRRFINMLIQGSSKKGHYMFELVRNKLNEYNPNLAKSYGEVMSINDLIYWLLDDETINQMASQPSAMAGKEEIEQSEDGTIIKTEAICFPVSLHEIIKGIMETFGTQGLPDDPKQANMIIDAVDSLSNETMDLRLGAIIWEKFIYAYPRMVFDEGNRYLQHYLFSRFCGLETTEFFRVARMIMANDPKGAKYMERMTDEIISDLNVDEFEENQDDNEDDINIDDLFNYKKGGQTKNKKGDIGKSGTQYGYTLAEWERGAKKRGLLVSPTEYWKSIEGTKYKDSFGRTQTMGRYSSDKENQMNIYGYIIAIGMDLGSKKIPASAKKYVQENNLNKFGEGGGVGTKFYVMDAKDGKILSKGFDTEEEAKVEKFKIFEKTNNFFLTQKEMTNDGGGSYIDLFEDYENIPANVQEILDEYDLEEDSDYDTLLELQNRLETIGYTFEYELDAVPYGLRPSSVKLNELEGYENEEYAGGGKVSAKLKKLKSEMKQIWEELDENYSDKKEMLMSAGYNGSDANDLKHEEWKYLGNDVQIKLINDYFAYYEKLAVYVQGVGSIYNGTSMQSAVNKANSYLKNNPKAEIVISDEKYGDTYDLDGYKIDEEYAEGGEAGFDIYNYDEKMALINLGQVYEYAIKLDKMIKEDTDLEEWVKMKLTRIEQNISDVKHSLEGWEKYEDGGEIPKKQLLHIAKYSKDLIEMISNGSKLMSWQEDKLAISSASIDDIYHHLDYEMGNRAEDLDVDNEYRRGGFVSKGELVWKKLSSSDKINFLNENFTPQITPRTQQTLTGKAYNFLPKNVKIVLESKYANVEDYAYGGEANENTKEIDIDFLQKRYFVNYYIDNNKNIEITSVSSAGQDLDYEKFGDSLKKIILEEIISENDEYAYGGEVQDWMEKALQSLIEETGNNNLQIFYVKENEFTCQDDDSEEYRVFKNEDLAYDYAVEEVESDMEYQPENFNRDFIMEYVEIDDLFVNSFENINYDYTKDIQSEKSEKYENRLIEELVANGLISEEEAQTRSSKELDEEYTQDYIDLLTSEQIGDDNGITHFIDNFGENEFFTLVYENNLIDVEDASKKAVEIDGIAHFLAGYDGETIYLDNNIVAYRTN